MNDELNKELTKELIKWQEVITQVLKSDQDIEDSKRFLESAAKQFEQVKNSLSDVSKEDIVKTIHSLPVQKVSSILDNSLSKTSLDTKLEITKLQKQSGVGFGKAVFPLITFFFALKNMYYASHSFGNIVLSLSDSKMDFKDIFNIGKLNNLIDENLNNPEELIKVTKLVRAIKLFIDEFISLFANTFDFIIDLIFLIPTALTAGASTGLNAGISIFILLAEYKAEQHSTKPYRDLLKKIFANANRNINKIMLDDNYTGEESVD